MNKKIRVCLLFGGKSTEHEISLMSAKSIYDNLDKNKYEVVLVGIDKQGHWILGDQSTRLLESVAQKNNSVITPVIRNEKTSLVAVESGKDLSLVDVFFPVIHGTYGEDGCLQGFLELLNVPYVGANVIGSALGMDKDVQKRLLNSAGIKTAKFITVKNEKTDKKNISQFIKKAGFPLFVKPASLGSSIGITKVKNQKELVKAVRIAFKFDTKIMLEEAIAGRELECSVLGNDFPKASLPGEVIPRYEFYSYEAKYFDEKGAALIIPAQLPARLIKKVQQIAVKAFQVLECFGMARVDLFLTKKNQILVNEINTIPGFTKISMYPKLWEASGLSYQRLINELIRLALEKRKKLNQLKRNFSSS